MDIKPGGVIGILGGGQLGRMLAHAAQKLGFRVHIFCTNKAAPAFHVTDRVTIADYDDEDALRRFAEAVDLITFEFENIPVSALEFVAAIKPTFPDSNALRASQDRLLEKEFIEAAGCHCAPYRAFESSDELAEAVKFIGRPAIAKRRLMGYDGKGQKQIKTPKDVRTAGEEFDGIPSILEQKIPFDREVSVVIARSKEGDVSAYPVAENVHENHVLAKTKVPSDMPGSLEAKARIIAAKLADSLNYVGVMAVELFVLESEKRILVNEIAPRVHNTGHWTLDGAVTSQFEQHIRAICGLPLGNPDALGAVEMVNLFGADVARMTEHLADPDVHFYHYGKEDLREGRKTGHITRLLPFEDK